MSERQPLRLGIAVPTFNEAESLPELVDALRRVIVATADLEVTLLVIDDNSPDGTGDLAERLRAELPPGPLTMEVLHRPRKDGFGRAYRDGLGRLVASGDYDYVLQMDADLSHDPKFIPDFLAQLPADAVIGSRYITGGATPDWDWRRRLLSRGGNHYARLFLGRRLTDYTGGYNLWASSLLAAMDLERLQATGYGCQIELKSRALALSDRVREVP
ncbi:MAG: glycosyltransferase, partial [Acidimicrobiales bacterium]